MKWKQSDELMSHQFHIFHYEKQSGPPFYQNGGGSFSLGLLPSPFLKLTTNKPDPYKVDGLSYAYIDIAFASMRFVVLFPFLLHDLVTAVGIRTLFWRQCPHTVCPVQSQVPPSSVLYFQTMNQFQSSFLGATMLEELLLRHCSRKTPGKFMSLFNAPNLVYLSIPIRCKQHYSLLASFPC
ncbi:hypothetical protein CXB51_034203 [Gossypium anomalum]|uniref:Uncharacterized protein n=1 Tax=Gossypium anomalum TaxID=47600 RepID=A0A8J5Y5W6_9ROSI|nr:hypothetical protein CXB51_034203 [Gossypium anomalum]